MSLLLSNIGSYSKALRALLGNTTDNDETATTTSPNTNFSQSHDILTSAVFGRLPLFGPPPDLDDDESPEDPDMEDDDDKTTTPKNERLQAYQTNFGLVDRCFLAQTVRDLLLCHAPNVSETGVERGSCKAAAEQVWSLRFAMLNSSSTNNDDDTHKDDPAKGMEYAILETILSLVASSSNSSCCFSRVYLSRVLLELTKMELAIFPPAIVLAVSTLFQDYMPALTPAARHNLSQWLAFHLIHTDYQWPAGYWKIWEPFVAEQRNSSRGAFVQSTLTAMVENLSNPELLVTECLPSGSRLVDHLLPEPPAPLKDTSALDALQTSVAQRIRNKEDPNTLLQYLLGDEVNGTYAAAADSLLDNKWWKTGVVMRALLAPAAVEYQRLKADIEKARASTEDGGMEEDGAYKEDVLALVLDALTEYKPVLLGVMEKEAQAQGESGAFAGEIFVLEQMHCALFYSRTLMSGCVQEMTKAGLLSVEKILQWLLGDTGDEDNKARIFLRWWEFASAAIDQGMRTTAAAFDTTTLHAMEGVEEESTTETQTSKSDKKIKLLLQFLDPLLSYVVGRAGTVLSATNDVTKGSKLMPVQVDVLEGCKTVVKEAQARYYSLLRDTAPSKQLHDAWIESTVAGTRLASLLDNGGVPAV